MNRQKSDIKRLTYIEENEKENFYKQGVLSKNKQNLNGDVKKIKK